MAKLRDLTFYGGFMSRRFLFVLLVLFIPSVLLADGVLKNVHNTPWGMGISGVFGLGGEMDWIIQYKDQKESGWNELSLSKGISLFYFYPLSEHIEIGGDGRLILWNTDADEEENRDLNTMIDVSPSVKLFHRFDSRLKSSIRLSLGLSYNIIGEKDLGDFVIKNSFGYNYGIFIAFEPLILEQVSGILELGYLKHSVSGNIKGLGEYKGIKVSYKEEIGHFLINIGIGF